MTDPGPTAAQDDAFGPTERVALSSMQKYAAKHLAQAWAQIPHVTHNDEADVTRLDELRKARSASPLALYLKALSLVLADFPVFKAAFDADRNELVLKHYLHIGVAIDTPRGLLVGVVRDCDRKSHEEIATDIAALSAKAREKGLNYEEMSGGCFTVSSLGAIGGTSFTPIINAPQVAILGLSRLQERPLRDASGGLSWSKLLPLSLSYDHRVINGADAGRFMRALCGVLAKPEAIGLGAS